MANVVDNDYLYKDFNKVPIEKTDINNIFADGKSTYPRFYEVLHILNNISKDDIFITLENDDHCSTISFEVSNSCMTMIFRGYEEEYQISLYRRLRKNDYEFMFLKTTKEEFVKEVPLSLYFLDLL